MDFTQDELVAQLGNLSTIELIGLTKVLEQKWGVKAAPPSVIAPTVVQDVQQPAAEQQTEFDVLLVGVGEKKIDVIKTVRTITGLGLGEAKTFVEAASPGSPKIVKEGLSKADAEAMKAQLEASGGKVELK